MVGKCDALVDEKRELALVFHMPRAELTVPDYVYQLLEEPHDECFVGCLMLSFQVEPEFCDKVGEECGEVLKVGLTALDEGVH